MRSLAAALLVLVAVGTARAAEFIPGWDTHAEWDSNILKTENNVQSDYSIRTGPDIHFKQPEGDLQYDFFYRLRYQAFLETSGINDFDHTVNADLSWRIAPRTDFALTDDFGYVTNLNGIFQAAPLSTAVIVIPTRERVTYNTGTATFTHRFSQLWQLRTDISNELYDYRNPIQSDSLTYTGSVQVNRSLSPRTMAGFGTSFTRQEFSGSTATPDNGSSFVQGFGVFSHSFDRTLTLTAQAGPALTMPDATKTVSAIEVASYQPVDPATCPLLPDGTPFFSTKCQQSVFLDAAGNPPIGANGRPLFVTVAPSTTRVSVPLLQTQQVQDSINYFGTVTLVKSWTQWNVRLSYQRQASGSSGLGTSTTLDLYQGYLTWTPSRNWNVTMLASYATQQAASDVPQAVLALRPETVRSPSLPQRFTATIGLPLGVATIKANSNFQITTMRAELRGWRRLTKRLSMDGGLSFWRQESSNSGASISRTSTRNAFYIDIGFVYSFDPIAL